MTGFIVRALDWGPMSKPEPKRRLWNVAIEADADLSESDIELLINTMPGIDVCNIEEVEPVAGDRDAEPDCSSDEHEHCDDCGVCLKKEGEQCVCYSR